MARLLDRAMPRAYVDALRTSGSLPLAPEGIIDVLEAVEAVARGVDGRAVGVHGWRQLDCASASIDAPLAIVDAVEGRIAVLVDGGI